MRPTVYIETTIPSYYCDDRPALAGDIARTRQWWDGEGGDYECFISPAVLDELGTGSDPVQVACKALVEGSPILAVEPEVLEIAEAYRARRLMLGDPAADAIHLALASYYRMDYLITWNCRHLANANKARHLGVLNVQMGLAIPRLVTPHLLLPREEPA
ncbi:MAG: type II toxin-antitoxin system VapC family toxin [Phycisphaerales bacterium]|nr:MAG: type II toxin-antitoxin system VapC family toxin [Phycisphaerales bacterium]